MRKDSVVPIDSDLIVRVNVFDEVSGGFAVDATVQVIALADKFTDAVPEAVSLPITCDYVEDWETRTDHRGRRVFLTDGWYEGLIPDNNGIDADTVMYATIRITTAGGLVGTRREQCQFVHGEA